MIRTRRNSGFSKCTACHPTLEPRLKQLAEGLHRPKILQVFRDELRAEY